MPNANHIQVGGTHYKTAYEPWDFGLKHALPCLEFTAVVYVARARKKNGAEDYRKAVHYIDKITEAQAAGLISPPFVARGIAAVMRQQHCGYSVPTEIDFLAFTQANNLTLQEDVVIRGICDWKSATDLQVAKDVLMGMIDRFNP